MNCYLYTGERLVFEGDGWGIIIDDGNPGRKYSEGGVYGTHQVCTTSYMGKDKDEKEDVEHPYGENCWEPARKVAQCLLCDALVPEGIQALVLLQTWDKR